MTHEAESPQPPTTPVAEAAAVAGAANPWRVNDFRLLWLGRLTAVFGIQVQGAALLWQVYDIARREHPVAEASFYLGLVGLVQFLPLLFLTLPAGEMADRRDRRWTVAASVAGEAICAALFLALAIQGSPPLWALLTIAAAFGACRAFLAPASQAYLPMVVGRAALPRAIVAQSLAFQVGAIAGPGIGGLIVGVAVPLAYAVALGMFALALTSLLLIRTSGRPPARQTAEPRWTAMKAGLAYVWKTKVVIGAISLDLVVVLLGGVALLAPIFARDVLHVGAEGFGLMRASFGFGALFMALYLSRFPIVKRAGLWMFSAVAVFGLCTLVFGWSRILWLSAAALGVAGAADMISVNIRQTLIQLATPDEMRGRVSSVSMLFIGASNELGEFYSGLVSRLLGPVGAAIFGGFAALSATGLWAWKFPGLRKADRL